MSLLEKGGFVSFAKHEDVLTDKQLQRAWIFYCDHQDYVEKCIKSTNKMYEPSQIEDKNDPRIWKAEYWRWFAFSLKR